MGKRLALPLGTSFAHIISSELDYDKKIQVVVELKV